MGHLRQLLWLQKRLVILLFYACAFIVVRELCYIVVYRRVGDYSEQARRTKCDELMQTPYWEPPNKQACADCDSVTCSDLLAPNATYEVIARALRHSNLRGIHLEPDVSFTRITDCVSFVRESGYHMTPLDKEEAAFPIAYNIIMYQKVHQVETLLRAIYRPQNTYCIHVDANSKPETHQAMRTIASCFPNVFIASRLEHVVYAGFSRLQADINCIHDHLRADGPDWRYLINMAGEAFPLRTNAEIVRILKIYNGANDVEGIYGKRIIRSRFELEYDVVKDRHGKGLMVRKTGNMNKPVPHGIDIVRGSAYFTLSKQFVKWVINDKMAQDLLEWATHTYSPDEFHWATLHHNYGNPKLHPPGGYSGIPDRKPWLSVFAAWRGMDKCSGSFVRNVCIFGVGDLSSLVQRKELTLNKFYIDREPLALHCMQVWIEHNSLCPPELDYSYYRSLPFVVKKQWTT